MNENTELEIIDQTDGTTPENVTTIQLEMPSVKDQLVAGAVGVGITAGAYLLLAAGVATYGKVSRAVSKRRYLKKVAAAKAAELAEAEASDKESPEDDSE